MNWMQAYEIGACIILFCACVTFNAGAHQLPRLARMCTALLGLSALVRGAALIAKYAGIDNLSRTTIAAADGNIPLLTAVLLGSIVWQQIKARIVDECGNSSDAR
jgi:hypothetical protein